MCDAIAPDCAILNCDFPMTIWSIYCQKHEWIEQFKIETIQTR